MTIRELGGRSEKGGLSLVQRYAHVGEGLKRDAVEALARGERLVRYRGSDGGYGLTMRESDGAEGGTRTPTPLRALDPESSASANSATSAPSRPQRYHRVPGPSRRGAPRLDEGALT